MSQPQISVILPVYNGDKFLEEAIKSILNQTFNDLELVIINDGSTDKSKSIIERFSDKRIRVIEHSNKGLAKTLNIGAANCNGKYIARMDQDDISDPNRLFIQYNYLERHPDISVLSCGVHYINAAGDRIGRTFPLTCPTSINKKLLNSGCVICHPGVLMRKFDFNKIGGYSETIGGRFTDYHLWVKFIKKGYIIKNLPDALLEYRISESSMSSEFTMNKAAKKLLIKVVNQEFPNQDEVIALNNACKADNQSFNKRKKVYNNCQNMFYYYFPFLDENTKSKLFSGIKNLLSLI